MGFLWVSETNAPENLQFLGSFLEDNILCCLACCKDVCGSHLFSGQLYEWGTINSYSDKIHFSAFLNKILVKNLELVLAIV